MCFDVCCQCALDGKRPEAVHALVRLFMRVYAYVSHNVTGLLKFLRAIDTLVPFHTIHLPHSASLHYVILCCLVIPNKIH